MNIFTARSEPLTQGANCGFESPKTYANITRYSYFGLTSNNIRKAFSEMWQLSLSRHGRKADSQFMTKVVKTDWLAHIESILDSARRVHHCIVNAQENVLIYCPNGSSGSALLSSLAQIFLDPYYRTIKGFQVLVYKEWLYYQHNFLDKNQALSKPQNAVPREASPVQTQPTGGLGMAAFANNLFSNNMPRYNAAPEKSTLPIFFLFLDAVHQLIKMNPLNFEFTSEYLAKLASKVYTNRYFEFVWGEDVV